MDDRLVGFSAFHAGYLDLEYGVLFYSPYVEVGESAGRAVFGDCDGVQVLAVCFDLDDRYCGGLWFTVHLCRDNNSVLGI